jgi:hypothetical protein
MITVIWDFHENMNYLLMCKLSIKIHYFIVISIIWFFWDCQPNFVNPVSHPWFSCFATDGSGCLIRMIRMNVLRQKTSLLLLICTDFGCGTVLTAACIHQGCSATDYILLWPHGLLLRTCVISWWGIKRQNYRVIRRSHSPY